MLNNEVEKTIRVISVNQRLKKIPNTKTQIPNSKNKNLLFREDTNQGDGI